MKFTFDKNYLLVQVAIVVIFYLLNTWLANKDTSKHFNVKKNDSITPYEMFTYVSGLQYGAPGSKLEPVSSEAKTISLLQRVLFISMALGGLKLENATSTVNVPGFGFSAPKVDA